MTAAAAKVLEPGTEIRAVGFGRANGRWSTTSIVLLAVFAAIFVVALALGLVIFPGGLLIIVFSQLTWPPRIVVVADRGVATMNRSVFTGRPTQVIARLPHGALGAAPGGSRKWPLGPDVVTLSDKEHRRLLAAVPLPSFSVG